MKRNTRNNLFYVACWIWCIISLLYSMSFPPSMGAIINQLNKVGDILVLVLLTIQILFFQIYEKKQLIIIMIVSSAIIVSAVKSSNYVLLSTWVFILACKNVDYEDAIRIPFILIAITLPIILIMYSAGLLNEITLYRSGLPRYALGFTHPNILGSRVLQLIMGFFFYRRERIRLKEIAIGIAAILFVWVVPNSKTPVICMSTFIALVIIREIVEAIYNNRQRYFSFILIGAAFILNVLSIIFSIMDVTQNKVLNIINKALSARFYYLHLDYTIYGITAFGQRLNVTGEGEPAVGFRRLYLDNAYMGVLLWYGIILYVLFSLFYLYVMYFYYKNNQHFIVIILFVYALYGFMEHGTYNLSYNYFMLLFSAAFYNKEIERIKVNTEVKARKIIIKIRSNTA